MARANIAGAGMTGPKASYSYTGKVTMFGRALIRGTDFAVSYKNNVKVGTATVTAIGKGIAAGNAGYKAGSKTAVFKVRAR